MTTTEMIKGKDPWKNKKESLEDKLKYFCSKHHWDNALLMETLMGGPDKTGDGYMKPTLKLFLYNCWREFLGWNPIFKFRMFLQEITRDDGISDAEIWETGYHIAKDALKRLYAFKNLERHGYPGSFSEYNENEWKSKEEYDEAIKSGKMIGGGKDAWEKVLDHIIMALEYRVHEGDWKWKREWYIKHFGMDPHDETNECNKYVKYEYREKDSPASVGCIMSFNKMPDNPDNCEYIKKETCYGNTELILYIEDVVKEGERLFGEFYVACWD